MTEQSFNTLSLEEQVRAHKELSLQISALEEKRKELGLLIMQQMPEKKVSLGDYVVRRHDRFTFKTPIEEARKLGATKEVLDKEALKKLYESGQEISGVSHFSYISVQKSESILPAVSDPVADDSF